MKVIVQRSLDSSVSVDNKVVGSIKSGLVLLVGFNKEDTISDIDYIVKKVINLRIFDDENGVMNKSIIDTNGEILSISQFTLYAITKNGNRPSYIEAMGADQAREMFNIFNEKLNEHAHVESGVFQAEMLVNIKNDGPVTIIIESGDKKC